MPRIVAIALLLSSLALLSWNMIVRSPLSEPTSRPAAAAKFVSPHAQVHPYSANTFLAHEVEPWRREKTMEMISLAGIGWIKQQFLWSQIEPAKGRHWDNEYQQDSWKKYDEIVDLAESYGVRVIARLDHTPVWARDEESDFHSPPTHVSDYGDFVEEFVTRYQGRVQYLQIWNEPNLAREWGGDIDPDGYFALLREAYTRAKAADPNVVILSAPMAMTNETSERAIPEFEYWARLYELGANDYFDILTATGFGIDDPPETEPVDSRINLRRIEHLRDIMSRYADDYKAVWLTEYGWNAPADVIPEDRRYWGSVTPTEQAEWTARGIEWMSEHWEWFGVSSIWYFRQTGVIPPSAAEYYFAMVDLEFTPRRVYQTVQEGALNSRIALPGSYGPLESPVQHRGGWARFDEPVHPNGQGIVGDEAGDQLIIQFSGTKLELELARSIGSFGSAEVSIDGEILENVSRDSFVTLEPNQNDGRLVIVDGHGNDRPQQEHEVRITLAEDSQLAIVAVHVDYERSYVTFFVYSVLSVVGMVGSIVLFRR